MNIASRATFVHHGRVEQITLGMAQLAPRGLSEDWWLKHLGDVHWQLIAEAVGQETTVFRDRKGRQLYAAFCATEFSQTHPDTAGLGKLVKIQSELWSAGRSRIQSNHRILMNGVEIARVRLVSTFVAHMQAEVNASVRKASPYLIPVLEDAPDDFANEASQLAKIKQKTPSPPGESIKLSTAVGTDFNAVGLLYFPSFTRLLEQTEIAFSKGVQWTPVKNRLVLYFGNIERGEPVSGANLTGASGQWALHHFCSETECSRPLAYCKIERF